MFPSVSVPSHGFLLIFASDKNRTSGPYLHLNFKIKSAGEESTLTRADGQMVDQVPPTNIPQDESFGRKPDGQTTWYFFTTPTPGAANTTTGYLGTLSPPVFSKARGFYTSAFAVILTTSASGATIRYTTNGSDPTTTSTAYTTPISITAASGNLFKATVSTRQML